MSRLYKVGDIQKMKALGEGLKNALNDAASFSLIREASDSALLAAKELNASASAQVASLFKARAEDRRHEEARRKKQDADNRKLLEIVCVKREVKADSSTDLWNFDFTNHQDLCNRRRLGGGFRSKCPVHCIWPNVAEGMDYAGRGKDGRCCARSLGKFQERLCQVTDSTKTR